MQFTSHGFEVLSYNFTSFKHRYGPFTIGLLPEPFISELVIKSRNRNVGRINLCRVLVSIQYGTATKTAINQIKGKIVKQFPTPKRPLTGQVINTYNGPWSLQIPPTRTHAQTQAIIFQMQFLNYIQISILSKTRKQALKQPHQHAPLTVTWQAWFNHWTGTAWSNLFLGLARTQSNICVLYPVQYCGGLTYNH